MRTDWEGLWHLRAAVRGTRVSAPALFFCLDNKTNARRKTACYPVMRQMRSHK